MLIACCNWQWIFKPPRAGWILPGNDIKRQCVWSLKEWFGHSWTKVVESCFWISLATSHVEPGLVKYSNLKDHCAKQSAFRPRWAKASAAQRLAKAQWAMSYAMDAMSFHGSLVATREVLGRLQVPAQTSRILPVMLWHHVFCPVAKQVARPAPRSKPQVLETQQCFKSDSETPQDSETRDSETRHWIQKLVTRRRVQKLHASYSEITPPYSATTQVYSEIIASYYSETISSFFEKILSYSETVPRIQKPFRRIQKQFRRIQKLHKGSNPTTLLWTI